MNILVIDDDAFVLKLLKLQLANLGQPEVMTCESANDALEALADRQQMEIVFCDIQMPGMDGVELVRHLAHMEFQGGLVLMSGEDERILSTVQYLAQAHRLKVLGALQKPITPVQLRGILQGQASPAAKPRRADRKIYSVEAVASAIENGELINYYQPKVSMCSREVVGVEALVRWQHPYDGLVFPDQFISTAEQNGLIDDLTRLVLLNALRHCRDWQASQLRLSVAVNISMSNLVSLDFPDFIVKAAQDLDFDLSLLILEVTESQLMQNPLTALDILTRLRLKNITLSIDDFGTGHSTLTQLRDIPFNELKVDSGFVHDAGDNASCRAILEASLDLARRLGMKSVAEGVENLADWHFLSRLACCDVAQGYFIAKPMPAQTLPSWIQEWQVRRTGLTE
ncbi:EAL domain-containing response regulator [Marinobacterium sp. D7]|uniref:EAL domain-containing response regulator n=1 Tax=Marinobacterium ramblicola TaxID=2849041 RepID=UPI001C2D0107|nr:EAL domain-containing response regulator [Marinobacterium ramblicola]MBV1787960.1 EAL domain-containing response regulator [Marinobacterium ramblicola]